MSGAGRHPLGWRVLIGTDDGYSPLVRTALQLHHDHESLRLLVLFGADDAFPFRPRPSTILVPGMPPGVIASIPALEEVGIASRLTSTAGLPGCHDGTVTELAALWLQSLAPDDLEEAHITVIGVNTLATEVATLAHAFGLAVTNISV